ncbi:MAG: hypothetical protein SLAVMIC_00358 [uncultured marine phage]|uniref:Uncharacterized protein n=1 Tax=uncultured marine phage TaxID=707152 RepID=A0A8D9FQ59_9VIRU|nr:MAG: hypothetical protein SLAVMIC_00358 [uncultured marine phage]
MSKLRVYRYGYKDGKSLEDKYPTIRNYDDLLVLAYPRTNDTYIGCVIGSNRNKEKYPIGGLTESWTLAHMGEMEESVTIKSKDKLYSNGKSILIRRSGGDLIGEGYTLINEDKISDVTQTVAKDTLDTSLYIKIDGKLEKFKIINRVTFKNPQSC